jgi:hypothetical protein
MNTLDDLRRSLDGRATGASDGHGLVQAVREGAIRVRRRRRIAGAAATACLVVAVAAVVPVVVARQRADHPPVVAVTPPYRQPGQVTLGLARSKYYPVSLSTDGSIQRLTARNRDATENADFGGDVVAYDPGTYDPTALRRGTRMNVAGHDAWLTPDYRFSKDRPAWTVLGWQDPSGVWVLVLQLQPTPDVPNLTAFALAVRIGPARELATPFQLASGPDGLPLTAALASGGPDGFTDMKVVFGTVQSPVQFPYPTLPKNAPLTVYSTQSDNLDLPTIRSGLTGIAPIAGHPAWYGDGTGRLGAPVGGGQLLVDAGNCTVQFISADRAKIGRDDLTAMAATATYGDCWDSSTWTAPLNR